MQSTSSKFSQNMTLNPQQNPKKKEEQLKKQQEMEEKRKVMLQSLLTNEARERCIIYL